MNYTREELNRMAEDIQEELEAMQVMMIDPSKYKKWTELREQEKKGQIQTD